MTSAADKNLTLFLPLALLHFDVERSMLDVWPYDAHEIRGIAILDNSDSDARMHIRANCEKSPNRMIADALRLIRKKN